MTTSKELVIEGLKNKNFTTTNLVLVLILIFLGIISYDDFKISGIAFLGIGVFFILRWLSTLSPLFDESILLERLMLEVKKNCIMVETLNSLITERTNERELYSFLNKIEKDFEESKNNALKLIDEIEMFVDYSLKKKISAEDCKIFYGIFQRKYEGLSATSKKIFEGMARFTERKFRHENGKINAEIEKIKSKLNFRRDALTEAMSDNIEIF